MRVPDACLDVLCLVGYIIDAFVELDKRVTGVGFVNCRRARVAAIPIGAIEALPSDPNDRLRAKVAGGRVSSWSVLGCTRDFDALFETAMEHGSEGVVGRVKVASMQEGQTGSTEVIVGALLAFISHASDPSPAAITRNVLVSETALAKTIAGFGWLGLGRCRRASLGLNIARVDKRAGDEWVGFRRCRRGLGIDCGGGFKGASKLV